MCVPSVRLALVRVRYLGRGGRRGVQNALKTLGRLLCCWPHSTDNTPQHSLGVLAGCSVNWAVNKLINCLLLKFCFQKQSAFESKCMKMQHHVMVVERKPGKRWAFIQGWSCPSKASPAPPAPPIQPSAPSAAALVGDFVLQESLSCWAWPGRSCHRPMQRDGFENLALV